MPRNRLFSHALLPIAFMLAASPAAACLPPPPGTPEPAPPTREEMVRSMVRTSTDIVSGKVLGYSNRTGRLRFRVEHVYKGKLRPGTILNAWQGWGIDRPMCFGMITPPPAPTGSRGTIFFYGEPEINFVADDDIERVFAMDLLQRPPQRRRR